MNKITMRTCKINSVQIWNLEEPGLTLLMGGSLSIHYLFFNNISSCVYIAIFVNLTLVVHWCWSLTWMSSASRPLPGSHQKHFIISHVHLIISKISPILKIKLLISNSSILAPWVRLISRRKFVGQSRTIFILFFLWVPLFVPKIGLF